MTDDAEIKKTAAVVNAPVEVLAGASFEVEWSGPKNASDYLLIQSEDSNHNFNVVYIGAQDVQSPTLMLAPEEAGSYQVHYKLKDKTSLADDRLLVVTPEASVDAPESVVAGQSFLVTWSGPQNEFDSLRVFNSEGQPMNIFAMLENNQLVSPAKLTAPINVGEYEVRYKTLGKKILAKDTFSVIAAVATVSVRNDVVAGAPFEVSWTGPRNQYDRLRIIDSDGKRLNKYKFVNNEKIPNRVEMIAPAEPGEYSVIYDAASKKILAQAQFSVTPVVAMVSAPETVLAGSEYKVVWFGPNYKGDSIYTFSADGKDMREYIFLGKKTSTSPITFTAPKEPGVYELRYQLKGRKVIDTHRFIVK